MIEDAAFQLDAWHDMWVMIGGAAAALTGLLFVAVSINLDRIIHGQGLPRRAAETLVILVSTVALAALCLTPQSPTALGVETLPLAALVLTLTVARLTLTADPIPLSLRTIRVMVLALVGVPLLAGGVSLLLGAGGGLYWFLAAALCAIAGAVFNAWVLLVEIVR